MDVRTLFPIHLKNYTVGFWAWLAGVILLVLFVFTLISRLFTVSHGVNRVAMEAGQSVIVHIDSAEMEGTPRHTRLDGGAPEPSESGKDSTIISKEGLAPAPLVSITEETERGLIPIVARDGTVPWKYYARPYKSAEKRPLVAILITNLALSRIQTDEVLKMSHNFTLSFSPYAGDAKKWAKKAREEGFESLVDIPLEPGDYPVSDGGPYGIASDLSATENTARLHWALSRFPGFVGMLAPIDEKLTADLTAIRPLLTELTARGVLFLYVRNDANRALAEVIKSQSYTALGIDKTVDDDLARSAIDAQLQSLVDIAKSNGSAIGVAHSYPPTLEELADWSDTLKDQGVDLVPVSAIAQKAFP